MPWFGVEKHNSKKKQEEKYLQCLVSLGVSIYFSMQGLRYFHCIDD